MSEGEQLDEFVEGLDYPVFVVTATDGEDRGGCLVGFATQASIDPARFLVGLSKANATTRVVADVEFLAVHRLGRDQLELARLFGEESGDWTDKLAEVRWSEGPHGVPVLADAAAYLVGRIIDRFDLGDHIGMLLEPVTAQRMAADATLMFTDVQDLDAGHPA